MGNSPAQKREDFWRHLTLPVECKPYWWRWEGIGYRWFESANVVPLERYRDTAEMERIRTVLLRRRT